MISTQGYNAFLLPYLLSAGLPGSSASRSTTPLLQLNNYNSSSLLSAYTSSQTSGQLGSQATQQVSSVWNSFSSLNTLAKTFTATDSSSAFSQRAVTSSNDAAVTAKATGGAALANYSIGVSQLATAQQNSGTALLSSGTSLSAGLTTSSTYSFSMTTTSGVKQSYYVTVKPGEQDQKVLQKMADAINAANSSGTAAVKAQVTTTVNGGMQYSNLVLSAVNTGSDNGFTLSDTSGSLATNSGVGSSQGGSVAAQNASYTVNGVSFSSQSNTATIKNTHITMSFAKTTLSDATLAVGQDVAGVTNQMNNFVQQYNATINALQNSGLTMASKLINRLTQSISPQASDLENIGLTLNPDHTLSLDQSAFQQALTTNPGQTQSLLSGHGDLARGVQSVAQSVNALPPSWLANTQNPFAGTDSSQPPAAQFQQYIQNNMFGMFFGSSGSFLNISA